MSQKPLKILRLLEPDLCLDCAFSSVSEITDDEGRVYRTFRCRRGDCDNWDLSDVRSVMGRDLEESA